MSNSDLEDRLRQILRPVDPGEEFSRRVLARVERENAPGMAPQSRWPFVRRKLQWLSAALAASLVVAVIGAHVWQQRIEERAGLAAREQLIEALRLTSEKLDLAYQGVQAQPQQENEEDPPHDS